MKLADWQKQVGKADPRRRNPVVACNALYKTSTSVNCYLTASQALELSRNLLLEAQIILDAGLEDAALQVWNSGRANMNLRCGLIPATRGRRKRPHDAFSLDNLPKPRAVALRSDDSRTAAQR